MKEQLQQRHVLQELIVITETAGILIWFCGGYALDALEGRLTRQHTDIDLLVRQEDKERLKTTLLSAGFRLQTEGPHYVVFVKMEVWLDCLIWQRMSDGTLVTDRGEWGVYFWPDDAFPDNPNATLAGHPVRVISYGAQYVSKGAHRTFDPDTPIRDKDMQDLEILCRRIPSQRRKQLALLFYPLTGTQKRIDGLG